MNEASSAGRLTLLCAGFGLAASVVVAATPIQAASAHQADHLPPAAQADSDGDRLSDDLEHDLEGLDGGATVSVIVRSVTGGGSDDARAVVGDFEVVRELPLIDGFAARMTGVQIRGLAASGTVQRIEPDTVVSLTDEGTLGDFGATRAQLDLGADGAGVGICVIDSGVDTGHEQLDAGKVVGWIDFVSGLPTPYDDHDGGHGTHVASIAAGDGTGGPLAARYRGVAPAADLYVAKAFAGAIVDDIPVISPGTSQASVVIAAIDWCARQAGVDVISMSFTATGPADGTDALSAAVDAAVLTHGKVAVAAAGNDGPNPGFLGPPGASANAITVGAVAEWSLPLTAPHRSEGPFLAAFSSRGPTLDGRIKPDVVAPGHSVRAAAANSVAGYADKDGTSMATPFAAGAAALALSANPALTPQDVAGLIEATAVDRGAAGKDADWGAGLIDVYGLVAATDGSALYEPTAFPTHRVEAGSAAPGNPFSVTFDLGPADLDVPIAATVIIDGAPDAASGGVFWKPDLQAELYDPAGVLLDRSQCPLGSDARDCIGNVPNSGRQELLHSLPTLAGTYTIVVSAAGADGGSFLIDLSHGPVASVLPGPCTTSFIGAGDGTSWHDPGNWSAGLVPLPTDVACVPAAFDVLHTLPITGVAGLLVDGALRITAGSTVEVGDPLVVSGRLTVDGGARIGAASPLDLRGLLTGTGTVAATVVNAGDVMPGDPTGVLTVDGDYRQGPAGILGIDVASTAPGGSDWLDVQGGVALAGTLRLVTGSGFTGSEGDAVTFLTVGAARGGGFVTVDAPDPSPALRWTVDYATLAPDVRATLEGTAPPPPGETVAVCHRPGTPSEKTLFLPPTAATAHQRSHGDAAGGCA